MTASPLAIWHGMCSIMWDTTIPPKQRFTLDPVHCFKPLVKQLPLRQHTKDDLLGNNWRCLYAVCWITDKVILLWASAQVTISMYFGRNAYMHVNRILVEITPPLPLAGISMVLHPEVCWGGLPMRVQKTKIYCSDGACSKVPLKVLFLTYYCT